MFKSLDLLSINSLFSIDRNSSKKNKLVNKLLKDNFEAKKKEAMKKSADHENVVVLSLVIEASIEASFQVSVTK